MFKKIIAVVFVFFGLVSFSYAQCPDLSGRYKVDSASPANAKCAFDTGKLFFLFPSWTGSALTNLNGDLTQGGQRPVALDSIITIEQIGCTIIYVGFPLSANHSDRYQITIPQDQSNSPYRWDRGELKSANWFGESSGYTGPYLEGGRSSWSLVKNADGTISRVDRHWAMGLSWYVIPHAERKSETCVLTPTQE